MIPTLIDQVELGLSRNIDFLDKENFNKLLKLFLEEIQELEVATLAIADQKNINTAIGAWLDYIGSLVGQPREGRTDEEYRAALLLKIAANSSDGTPNTIIDITKQYTGSSSSKIIEYYHATFVNVIESTLCTNFEGYFSLVEQIKPVAVNAVLVNNINGNRFTPAWRVPSAPVSGNYIIEVGVSGVLQPLIVNGTPLTVYGTVTIEDANLNAENSYLYWKNGNSTTQGYLAQRIYKDTTSIVTCLSAESFATSYFGAASTMRIVLETYPD